MNIEFKRITTKSELVDYVISTGELINDGISKVNDTNDAMISVVDKSITSAQSLTESLKLIANQIQDIMILDGYMANIASPFLDIKYQATNMIVDKENLTLRIANKNAKSGLIKNISTSVNNNPYIFDKASFLNNTGKMTLATKDKIMEVDIDVLLSEEIILSELLIDIEDNGTKLPHIESIKILSMDGKISEVTILNSNKKSYSINSRTETIRFAPTLGNRMLIKMVKNDSRIIGNSNVYEMVLNNIKVFSAESFESGEIIFGPIKSSESILKAGVYLTAIDTDYKADLYISTDNINWTPISNINSISTINQILNINNIDPESIQTDYAARSIYVKLVLYANMIQPNNTYDKYIIRNVYADNGYAEIGYDDGHQVTGVYEDINKQYGRISLMKIEPSKYEKPYGILDGKKLSLVQDKWSYVFEEQEMKLYTDPDGVLISYKSGTCSSLYPGNNISVYTVNTQENQQRVPITTNAICCIKLKVPCDIYHIESNKGHWTIDLSNGYSRSVDCFNYYAEAGDVANVYDSWGNLIAAITANKVENDFVISPYDTFFHQIQDPYFNKYYPFGDVTSTYSISAGKIVCRGKGISSGAAYVQNETVVNKKLLRNSVKKEILFDRPYISRSINNLDPFIFQNRAKLNQCKILKGSITIDQSGSPIKYINTEVDFIDGETEFTIYSYAKKTVSVSTSTIQLDGIKDNGKIQFEGEVDLFVNRVFSESDLLYRGDYFIDGSTLRLPNGLATSNFIATDILYESQLTNNPNGLYSVDYKNGVLYTQNKIRSNTNIAYSYSTVYASYVAVGEVPIEEYTDTGNSVVIYGSGKSYMIETKKIQEVAYEIATTPVLKDIEIRYTT